MNAWDSWALLIVAGIVLWQLVARWPHEEVSERGEGGSSDERLGGEENGGARPAANGHSRTAFVVPSGTRPGALSRTRASRSLTVSVDHRSMSDNVGVGGEQARSSSSVSRGLPTDAGGCICQPEWMHVMADADCPLHGLRSLARVGVYDQERERVWA